jgi:hypothetical protein
VKEAKNISFQNQKCKSCFMLAGSLSQVIIDPSRFLYYQTYVCSYDDDSITIVGSTVYFRINVYDTTTDRCCTGRKTASQLLRAVSVQRTSCHVSRACDIYPKEFDHAKAYEKATTKCSNRLIRIFIARRHANGSLEGR